MRTETEETATDEKPQTIADMRGKVSLFHSEKAYLITFTDQGRLPASEALTELAERRRVNIFPVDPTGKNHPTHQRVIKPVDPLDWNEFFLLIDNGWIESIYSHDE